MMNRTSLTFTRRSLLVDLWPPNRSRLGCGRACLTLPPTGRRRRGQLAPNAVAEHHEVHGGVDDERQATQHPLQLEGERGGVENAEDVVLRRRRTCKSTRRLFAAASSLEV